METAGLLHAVNPSFVSLTPARHHPQRTLLQLHRFGVLGQHNYEFPDRFTSVAHILNAPGLAHIQLSPGAKGIPAGAGGAKQHCLLVESFDTKSPSFTPAGRRQIQREFAEYIAQVSAWEGN